MILVSIITSYYHNIEISLFQVISFMKPTPRPPEQYNIFFFRVLRVYTMPRNFDLSWQSIPLALTFLGSPILEVPAFIQPYPPLNQMSNSFFKEWVVIF